MEHKAIIFDIDGTAIINADNKVRSERLISAIAKHEDQLYLCAATGRPVNHALPILKQLNLKHPCVTAAGTTIIDPNTEEILWECRMDHADVKHVVSIAEKFDYIIAYNEIPYKDGKIVQLNLDIRDGDDINVIYVLNCNPEDARKMQSMLADRQGIAASLAPSWIEGQLDVHVTHQEATKEHAVQELLARIGVKPEETIGVGDGDNDIHLFAAVGHKVAMGNATDELKKYADEVCEDIENDGLAKLIERTASSALKV